MRVRSRLLDRMISPLWRPPEAAQSHGEAMITRRSVILTALLAAGIFWAPLPFASVTPRGELVVELVAFIALAVASSVPNNSGRLTTARAVALLLAGLAALAWLQSVSLPSWLVHVVSPASTEFQREAAALLGAGAKVSRSISLAPAASRSTAVALLAWAAALYAGAVAGRHRWQRRVLALSVLLAALFQIVYGAQHWFARSQTIWGVLVPGTPRQLRGTYVNPDHLAYLLEAGLAIGFAGAVWALQRARRETGLDWRLFWVAPWALLWPLLF
ncbi:MAG TPA: hypothetical protein VKA53_04665, partial [Thermoanaerobaculia bacterium]|nr:hypothetical protein [Thermoanaerobaculia bacterium]